MLQSIVDGQNLAVLEKNINHIANGKETQLTRGFLRDKSLLFKGTPQTSDCVEATKTCAILAVLSWLLLVGVKDSQLLIHMGKKPEMQLAVLEGTWVPVHQGEGNRDLNIPHSYFFNLDLSSLPRFILNSLSPSSSPQKPCSPVVLALISAFSVPFLFCLPVSKS